MVFVTLFEALPGHHFLAFCRVIRRVRENLFVCVRVGLGFAKRKIELTFISTDADIQRLIRQGRLELFEPALGPGETYRRRLFLHPDIAKWLDRLEAYAEDPDYAAKVTSMLKAFVTGEDFDDDVACKPMKPHHRGIFELKITFVPQHRLFGGFLRIGEFVALTHETRRQLSKGQGFAPKINRAETLWRGMFRHPPLGGNRSRLLEDFCNEG